MSKLEGKIALVTGAASGMGLAFSQAMAAEGATVILADIAAEAGDKAAGEILDNGGKAEFAQLDVARAGDWHALATALESKYGRLDVLINNAGVAPPGCIEDCPLEVWQKTLDVNLTGVFLGCQTMLPLLRKSAAGTIINISSVFGIVGDQAPVAYCASKGAVRMLTKSAALHGATMSPPVRVNSVHPGFVETPMVTEGIRTAPEDLAREYMGRTVGLVPLGRIGQPDDITGIVLFLASDEARYVTGAEFVVDGGFTAR